MSARSGERRGRALRAVAAAAAAAALGWSAYAALTWARFGRARPARGAERDPLLDRFMPGYDVSDRHRVRLASSAEEAVAAARELDLFGSAPARAIFRARELMLRADEAQRPRHRGLLEETLSIGWGILADTPREVVVGAITRPWEADVVFRALAPEAFAAFSEPGWVKIAWTLRAEPEGAGCVFRTETRARATDDAARARFRRYWAIFSPGIRALRWLMLRELARAPVPSRPPALRPGL